MGTPAYLIPGSATVNVSSDGLAFTDIGATSGGVKLNMDTDVPEFMADQLAIPLNRFLNNINGSVEFHMAECTLALMAHCVPGLYVSGANAYFGDPVNSVLQTRHLKITKASPNTTYSNMHIYCPRVVPSGNPKMPFKKADAHLIPIKFMILVPDRIASNIITNGGFSSGASWTLGTGWSIAAGVATSANATGTLSQAISTLLAGVRYTVEFTISNYVDGTITPSVNGTAGTARSANGTYTETIRAGASGGLVFTPATSPSLDIDDVKIYPADALNIVYLV